MFCSAKNSVTAFLCQLLKLLRLPERSPAITLTRLRSFERQCTEKFQQKIHILEFLAKIYATKHDTQECQALFSI